MHTHVSTAIDSTLGKYDILSKNFGTAISYPVYTLSKKYENHHKKYETSTKIFLKL
jgi:hypothetical protein